MRYSWRLDEMIEHDMILRLRVGDPIGREQLEDLASDILEIVEHHASTIALGPVASAEFDPPAVELDLGIPAASREELEARVAEVVAIIRHHAVAMPRVEHELVPA